MGLVAMPIYEYVCRDCGFEFEKIRSYSDETMPACPSCQQEDVQRKLGVPAIHFKGSGWYINDSKSSDKKKTSPTTESSSDSDAKGTADKTPSTDVSTSDSSPKSEPTPVAETPPKSAETPKTSDSTKSA